MTYKHIIAICKKEKCLFCAEQHDKNGEVIKRFAGEGAAAYSVSGMLGSSIDEILEVMDVSKETQQQWKIKCQDVTGNPIFEDVTPSDIPLIRHDIKLIIKGIVLQPLYWNDGILFINEKYIPKEGKEPFHFYLRVINDSQYVAIKNGELLEGIVMGYRAKDVVREFTTLCCEKLNEV